MVYGKLIPRNIYILCHLPDICQHPQFFWKECNLNWFKSHLHSHTVMTRLHDGPWESWEHQGMAGCGPHVWCRCSFVCLLAVPRLHYAPEKAVSGGGRARHGCYGSTSLAGECGTNMCGTNICSVQYSPTFLPYKVVMDPSRQCKKHDRGEEDQVRFGALIETTRHWRS